MKTITNYKKIEQAYKVAHDQLELREQEVLANMGWHREKEQLIAKLSESQERVLMLNSELNRVKSELEQARAKPVAHVSIAQAEIQHIETSKQSSQESTNKLVEDDDTSREGQTEMQPKKPRASAAEIAAKLKNSANLIKRTESKPKSEELQSEFTEEPKDNTASESNKLAKESKPANEEQEAKPEEIKKIEGPKSKVPKKGAKKKLSLLEAEENILSYDASFD